jgi:hypothetical protein
MMIAKVGGPEHHDLGWGLVLRPGYLSDLCRYLATGAGHKG